MIIIAPDKFKGTMDARQAVEAIAYGLRDAGVDDRLLFCPMADGGDGTASVLAGLLPGSCTVVESHAHIGPGCFGTLPAADRSSHAFGTALGRALRGGGEVLAGIGGTACCDGGAGMLQALGMKAFAADGGEITAPLTPRLLPAVASVDLSGLPCAEGLTAISDVCASLVPEAGSDLSALDFTQQKGFAADELPMLERALRHWRGVASRGLSSAIDGAGGGIGFALATVLGAKVCSGADYVLDLYRMPLKDARLVITGEGRIDAQTGGGKVVAAVAARAEAAGTPVLAIAGRIDGPQRFPTLAIDPPGTALPASAAEAMARLRRAVAAAFKA